MRTLRPASLLLLSVASLLLAQTAQADDLAGVAGGLSGILAGIVYVVKVCLWVGGTGLLLGGIIQYKAHRVSPTQVRLIKPIMLWVVGTIFVILPFVMDWAINGPGASITY